MTDFATRLKTLREVAGLNQSELAKSLGVSRSSISFYEKGERVPDIEFLDKVTEFFGVPTNYMLGYIDNRKEEYINIGIETGLSDEAIEALGRIDAENLNYILCDRTFLPLAKTINLYLQTPNEEIFFDYSDKFLNYEFTNYLIGEYFKTILNNLKTHIAAQKRLRAAGIDPSDSKAVHAYYKKYLKESEINYQKQCKKYEEIEKKMREELDISSEEWKNSEDFKRLQKISEYFENSNNNESK